MNFEQNSDEWLSWRKKGIGSSDAPIIMGVSPWKTPYQLYLDKIEPVTYAGKDDKEPDGNWATEKGHALEPVARAKYELLCGMSMSATCVTHSDDQFMRASMDGFNTENNRGLEIKCGGRADFETTKTGVVPEKYVYQLAHQFYATDAKQIDFFYYYLDNENYKSRQYHVGEYHLIEVKPDLELIQNYLIKAKEFWNCVQTKTPPALSDKDYMDIKDMDSKLLSAEFVGAKALYDDAAKTLESVKKKIIEKAKTINHPRLKFHNISVLNIKKKGSIDYSKVGELKNIDLEKYRKPDSSFYKIAVLSVDPKESSDDK